MTNMTEDERAIRGVVDTWFAATKTGDITTVVSLMTDDVIFMAPAQEPFAMTATPRDGGSPVRRSGYTLTILRKESDGRWRLARDANLLTTTE